MSSQKSEIGSIVDLKNFENTEIQAEFKQHLTEYFDNVSSGQTGWGMSFISWLHGVKGWKHLGLRTFEKVEPITFDEN